MAMIETLKQHSEAPPTARDEDDDDLSPDQIQQLLKEAEQRLRAKHAPQSQPSDNIETEDSIQLSAEKSQSITSKFMVPRLNTGDLPKPYIQSTKDLAHVDAARLVNKKIRVLAGSPRKVEDPTIVKHKLKREKEATAGSDWFYLPRTKLTPELKRDLQLLKMRSVLDPKRHYKKDNNKQLVPDFCQVGTIIAGPTEFYSSRIPTKERRKTFVEEVLSRTADTARFKRKYDEIQKTKSSGKKAYYKNVKSKRRSGLRD